jgi:glucose dehydrogenase
VPPLLVTWLATAQEPARVVTPDELLNAGGDGTEWITYGHDYAETHFSPLSQINKKNVKRLSPAWSATTDAPQGTVETTPLMHDGVLYGILPWESCLPLFGPRIHQTRRRMLLWRSRFRASAESRMSVTAT